MHDSHLYDRLVYGQHINAQRYEGVLSDRVHVSNAITNYIFYLQRLNKLFIF